MTSSRNQIVKIEHPEGQVPPAGTSFRFTRDNSQPNETSELYTEPFVVDRTVTIRAIEVTTDVPETASDPAASFPIVIRVATPTISPAGGTFQDPQIITLACATLNADIRYTINGTIPDESSALYIGPFLVEGTVQIQARAFLSPKDPSVVATSNIVIASTSTVYFGYSPIRLLNEAQILAMSNAAEPTNMVVKTDCFGTYRIGSGATEDDFFVFCWPDTFSHPRASDGFNKPSSSLGNIAMAGPDQGYTDGPVNGFYHKKVTINGVLYREYASYYGLGNSSTPTITDVLVQ